MTDRDELAKHYHDTDSSGTPYSNGVKRVCFEAHEPEPSPSDNAALLFEAQNQFPNPSIIVRLATALRNAEAERDAAWIDTGYLRTELQLTTEDVAALQAIIDQARKWNDDLGWNGPMREILSQAPTPSVLLARDAATLRAAADEMNKTGMFIIGTYANEWLRARADALDIPQEEKK